MIIGKGLSVKKYCCTFCNLPQSFHGKRIVFLTDLHGKEYGKNNKILLSLIKEAKPDYLLIGGDMVVGGIKNNGKANKHSAASVMTSLRLLKTLSSTYPVFHALGNHEEKLENEWKRRYFAQLKELGIPCLDNEKIALSSENGEKIAVYGLSLGLSYYPKLKRKQLDGSEIGKRVGEKDGFTILMAHSPLYFRGYREWGADLILSGHFHGGILRLPYIGGVLGSDFIPFPKYSGGLYKEEGKVMIVSCGLGTHTIPLRIWNPPELSVIDLKCGE